MRLNTKSSLALVAATLTASASAHSWIEEASVIANNGTMVGQPGYPRAFAKRVAGVDPDKAMVHLLPPNGRPEGNKILDSDPMCMESQQQPKQSDGSPALTAAAGDMVSVRYQENGHVTMPENQPGKPPNRGTIYIYGTTQPKPDDKFLAIHKVWNADGTGGDKRGKLLATENYDDGQCYQLNPKPISTQRQAQFKHKADPLMGQDLWCQNNFKIPKDAPSGKPYTIYWVWDWDTAKGSPTEPAGKVEKYTTCLDINVSQGPSTNTGAVKFVDGQDLNFAAIPEYVNKLATSDTIFLPGTANSREAAGSPPPAAPAAPPAAAAPPPAAAAPAPPMSQPAAAAGPMTVTVTKPAAAKTVTVTAPAQAANSKTTMQTQVKPSSMAAKSSMAAASQPATVSGVVIPTTSLANRFTGTATAVSKPGVITGSATDSGYQDPAKPAPKASAASAPAPGVETGSATDSGYQNINKRCESCKPSKRSVIFNGSAQKPQHITSHTKGRSLANTKLHRGSAKFRAA
ncbi:MAG: hypothetical protein LQ350_000134 [Teloschistes chrysophthalmus]|nr:MAG: hypothetical protein LQ350_000134 [Niorma chrysophthalma]